MYATARIGSLCCNDGMDVTSLMRRSATFNADRLAIVAGSHRLTFATAWQRGCRMANALAAMGVSPGDRIGVLEDNSVEGQSSTMANLAVGWGNDRWRIQADVLNLFDSNDRDIQYFYASRLPGEPADGIEDIHYHVFEPRQVRVYASLYF